MDANERKANFLSDLEMLCLHHGVSLEHNEGNCHFWLVEYDQGLMDELKGDVSKRTELRSHPSDTGTLEAYIRARKDEIAALNARIRELQG